MPPTIAAGKVVSFYYAVTNDGGQVLDRSEYQRPLRYLHGAGNIVAGLERALAGKRVGDRIRVEVPAEEAYGAHDPNRMLRVPRSSLPPDVIVQPGMRYAVRGANGNVMRVLIADVQGEEIVLDLNHPMAGLRLQFDVTIAEIRDATDAESTHGHPDEPGEHRN